MNAVTIYHNPNCGSSRKALALIRNSGVEPRVVEYLQAPPTREELQGLLAGMGLTVRQLLREKEAAYAELDLGNPKWSDEELLDVIEKHPILMNRPVVATPLGVRLCRPPETVLEILPP